jgi:hypothetical protein
MRGSIGLLVLALAACGYHLPGRGAGVPDTAHSISVKLFVNRTREHGIEVGLRRAIEEEFRRRGPLTIAPEGQGDLILGGVIRRFWTTPVTFIGTSEAVQYQGVLQIAFRVTDRTTGRLVYENKLLQESLDFGAQSDVVVTSSPRFQRGTIDIQDLAAMNNVQVGEARKRSTLQELVDALAHDVYLQSMEGF